MNLKVSFDNNSFNRKPTGSSITSISKEIGESVKEIRSLKEMEAFILNVGLKGHTFCPATFKEGKRNKENFEQQQLFAMDFDNKDPDKKITFREVKQRSDFYELPILFAYDTLSSKGHDKFRIVFLNDIPVTDRRIAEAVQKALGIIFPEADPSCYKDVSKMYFGGKGIIYSFHEKRIPVINIESVFRNLSYCIKEKYKPNHYKEHMERFSKETGIALNKNGLLDVTVSYDPTELTGVKSNNQNGKNSPSPFIYSLNLDIKADGEIFPNIFYCINLSEYTSKCSVASNASKKTLKNHDSYRSKTLFEISRKCKLFMEFENGERKLDHDELYGLATNLIQIETGSSKFLRIRSEKTELYDAGKNDKWKYDLNYMKKNGYKPQSCNVFCPHHNKCIHGKNILSTVHPKKGKIEQIAGYHEEYYPLEEVQDDTYNAINNAFYASGNGIWVIKSMTGGGKSTSYLKLMSENPMDSFLIAAPTNLLKDEIYAKAKGMGIEVKKTPSLEQIKDEIPDKIWKRIGTFYKCGQYMQVHPYILEILQKKHIPCLREYMKEREVLKTWDGSMITTHRYLLNMDEKRLREYDAVIIDEDIIFKSIIPNQGEIPVTELKKILEETTDRDLARKIKKLLKAAETQSCIELESTEWDDQETDDDNLSVSFDIPSFCKAEKFYIRRESKELGLKEDTVTFLKSAVFKDIKYIMVSATVEKSICQRYFSGREIHFYECKKAEYKGELNQYADKSMSRMCIKKHPGIIQDLMEKFHIDDEDKAITFKKEKIGCLHFGNTEGSNTLEGENILVVGTPYHAEFLYKLAALNMEIDFDEDEEMHLCTVIHNGYRFWFTTFDNEDLRDIHFWMVESELEQAVGRARLLRNECKVYLFSNFPLRQARIISGFDDGRDSI